MSAQRQMAIGIETILAAVLCIPLGAALICLARPGFAADRPAAPDFSLQDIEGSEHSLAEYQGNVVLINFWATSCPPCIHEMPSLESLYNSLKDRGFLVIAVSSDEAGQRVIEAMVDRLHLSFPVLLDPDSKVTALYGVSVRPTTYLIDREGFLVSRIVGLRDWMSADQLASIRALMSSAPLPRGRSDITIHDRHGRASHLSETQVGR